MVLPEERVRLRIHDMLDAIGHVRVAAHGLTLESFKSNMTNRLAVERGVEIISEASRHIPEELKHAAPQIEWGSIAGIGNVLRHDYRAISAPIIWNVVEEKLGPLEEALRDMLRLLPTEE